MKQFVLAAVASLCLSATPSAIAATSSHGAALPKGDLVVLSKVLSNPDAYAKQTLLVEGTVKSVCTKKGCWMEIAAGKDAKAASCRVTFKDYGFFVPLDSKGATAKLAGTITVKTLPKSHVDHLQGEGGTVSGIQKDGSAREVTFVADGVELSRQQSSSVIFDRSGAHVGPLPTWIILSDFA